MTQAFSWYLSGYKPKKQQPKKFNRKKINHHKSNADGFHLAHAADGYGGIS